jgi:hypothetical protein
MKQNHCHRLPEISLLAAGALGEAEKIELKRHLTDCLECRIYHAEIADLVEPLHRWEKNLSGIEVSPAAKMRWDSAVKAAAAPSNTPPSPVPALWRVMWRELILPSRYAWAGMAALWLAMLVINGNLSGHATGSAGRIAVSTQEMQTNWEEQNRVLAELSQPSLGSTDPAPPPAALRPRSEKARDWEVI